MKTQILATRQRGRNLPSDTALLRRASEVIARSPSRPCPARSSPRAQDTSDLWMWKALVTLAAILLV
jgi:hypothetical protein